MIFNRTRQTVISKNEKKCTSWWSQVIGLMFHRKQNLVMIFPRPRKVRLHMFFVFYPIDVLLLDEKNRIVEIKRNFRPFAFWNSRHRPQKVVEMAFPGEYEKNDVLKFY
ncbi:DUF192 domain-containing protein [Candidatus Woesearchaeota archaeon]|nr:DUF192 domain-containing protein [Candidatus Woesearchaeota archaeon]